MQNLFNRVFIPKIVFKTNQKHMKSSKDLIFLSLGILFLSITVFLSQTALAQDKSFTIDEAVLGGGGKLIPKNLDQLQWVAKTSQYC